MRFACWYYRITAELEPNLPSLLYNEVPSREINGDCDSAASGPRAVQEPVSPGERSQWEQGGRPWDAGSDRFGATQASRVTDATSKLLAGRHGESSVASRNTGLHAVTGKPSCRCETEVVTCILGKGGVGGSEGIHEGCLLVFM